MIHVRTCLMVVALALVVSGACRRNSNAPSGTLDGTWSGTIVDSEAGPGTVVLAMSQVSDGVTGTWSAAFAGGVLLKTGTIGGFLAGSGATLFLSPAVPLSCPPDGGLTMSGTLSVRAVLAGNRLTGSYVVLACAGAITGTIDVQR